MKKTNKNLIAKAEVLAFVMLPEEQKERFFVKLNQVVRPLRGHRVGGNTDFTGVFTGIERAIINILSVVFDFDPVSETGFKYNNDQAIARWNAFHECETIYFNAHNNIQEVQEVEEVVEEKEEDKEHKGIEEYLIPVPVEIIDHPAFIKEDKQEEEIEEVEVPQQEENDPEAEKKEEIQDEMDAILNAITDHIFANRDGHCKEYKLKYLEKEYAAFKHFI